MSDPKDNGQDTVLMQVLEELRALRVGQEQTNARLDQANARLDSVQGDVKELRVGLADVRADVKDLRVDVKDVRHQVVEAREEAREYLVDIMGDTKEIREALGKPAKRRKTAAR